ncbi:metallophosphoesterase [Pseudooceanicola aestuarii]|uniref:metallophosphoesterase n=1 Tax=Pseudooceanicola aestuarii TaxID=2697319 RepID=UPI0013D8CB98|nr:metallophosphoesterase [Pseudooceanicola aestuarii]
MPPPEPEQAFYAIGDVHGRIDLLEELLARLDPDVPKMLVGDYVDRGENSADVLRYLLERPDLLCLLGNHEEMMIRFLDAPEDGGGRWLNYGGLQTLASFGVMGVSQTMSAEGLRRVRDDLLEAMGPVLTAWLRGLPHFVLTGNVAVVHAGADPRTPIEEQNLRSLLWGHRAFARQPRRDGTWVVHGHTIVDHPEATQGRIAIDTGAYATGRLSAVRLGGGEIEFVTTG